MSKHIKSIPKHQTKNPQVLECTLQFIIPEFKECWWDSLLIDLLGAFIFVYTINNTPIENLTHPSHLKHNHNHRRQPAGYGGGLGHAQGGRDARLRLVRDAVPLPGPAPAAREPVRALRFLGGGDRWSIECVYVISVHPVPYLPRCIPTHTTGCRTTASPATAGPCSPPSSAFYKYVRHTHCHSSSVVPQCMCTLGHGLTHVTYIHA